MGRIDPAAVTPEAYEAVCGLAHHARRTVDPVVLELVERRVRLLHADTDAVPPPQADPAPAPDSPDGSGRRREGGDCGGGEVSGGTAVADLRDTPDIDERQRTALALTDALTRLGEGGVPDHVWDAAARVWSERELAELTIAIATVDARNRQAAAGRLRARAHG
ncbi:carboxymuconolactone decarboxylase family protein [Micromonospora sp. NPDC000207]|uniref:carboxymuconolactone decarboxylase family protein n=1 Tax=Micromonospora sp. NPDC000207 TaxID=3154246 RepID=UPI00331AD03B